MLKRKWEGAAIGDPVDKVALIIDKSLKFMERQIIRDNLHGLRS